MSYFLGASFVVFSSALFHQYRSHREHQLKALYDQYPNKAEMFKEIHNKAAGYWDTEMEDYEWAKRIDKYRKVICSYVEGKVLEVGIGTGSNLHYYPKGIELLGVDWSEKMIEKASAKTTNGEFKVMDGRNLEFEDNSFDTVIGTFVLSSSESPDKIIKEMYRVCKTNGKVLILDRGRTDDILTSILLKMYRYTYLFQFGYDQCANIKRIISSVPAKVSVEEIKQGGHIYFYILTKSK